MKNSHFLSRPGRRKAAFSLVEVALSLGIVGFALVGIVGAIPVAMNNARASVAQTRAASLANTVFANLRSQSFSAAQYLDNPDSSDALDLNAMVTTEDTVNGSPIPQGNRINDPVVFYAVFDEVATSASTSDERRLHFRKDAPLNTAHFQIVLRFDNHPAGTLAPYNTRTAAGTTAVHAQANAIEASIFAESFGNDAGKFTVDHPKDVFHYNSLIANRLQ